jgi:predicted nuclease of predicted toxin-antitoxin system
MNFLIDANLPRRIVRIFQERGHDAVHTLDLPEGNATADVALLDYSEKNNCVITTKDSDFSTSFWLQDVPTNYYSFPQATSEMPNWKLC